MQSDSASSTFQLIAVPAWEHDRTLASCSHEFQKRSISFLRVVFLATIRDQQQLQAAMEP
jgi:hypothetical protein